MAAKKKNEVEEIEETKSDVIEAEPAQLKEQLQLIPLWEKGDAITAEKLNETVTALNKLIEEYNSRVEA
ncbi:hypothetical protein [Enterococcus pallens]|uniref:Uncharacterized protein n=1 Tax=Enterococcus pallens ATCC BAA-351 TaxID=1158607 RepID=R2QIE7_9ENTE|nr:hypothetical protein [Enterococcus pallens]EOH96387.1 hypothetical protein UAU_01038 [Enterococcus pallens ATCC BAA-351]EOU14400.1 hypothetical protein I588_04756 [Enterococcus pallens ATCC BAA-351]OJG77295.1 hypothetical protein RV10_GL002552 [Enterococcus pallens]